MIWLISFNGMSIRTNLFYSKRVGVVYICFILMCIYICIHIDAIIKTSDTVLRKIYLSLYLKGCVWEGVGDRTELQYINPPPLLSPSALCLSRSPGLLNRRLSSLLDAGFLYHILSPTSLLSKLVSKLTNFLSSPSYIIVQSPAQYLPITGHRDVSLGMPCLIVIERK